MKRTDLYELGQDSEWIADIIIKLNELGFYTVTSQPGSSCLLELPDSESSYPGSHERRQRAYIRGYMDKDMANYIVQTLDNKHLFVRSETYNKVLEPQYCQCGSVIFIDGQPGTLYFGEGEFDESFNLGLPLRRPYKDYLKMYDTVPNNLTNMSEFDIMDLRWDYNDDLWTELLSIILKYN